MDSLAKSARSMSFASSIDSRRGRTSTGRRGRVERSQPGSGRTPATAAAAALATVTEILEKNYLSESLRKEKIIRKHLQHSAIREIRGKGLMLVTLVETPELAAKIILKCLEKGLILFFLLFEGKAMRITPPLTISDTELIEGCALLLEAIEEVL